MEAALKAGKCKYIGVSNYPAALLEEMAEYAEIMPAVNQLELHPRYASPQLQATAKKHASSIRANWWHPSTWEWGLTRVAAGEVERETAARAQCTKYQDKCNGPPTASAERTPGAFCATVKAVAAVEYALTTWQRPAEAFADQILPVGSLFCADVIFDLFGANGLGAYFMYEYETRCYEW